jgi:hypothetical protein
MIETRPWQKVIYSALKPNTRSRWFILLECGHVIAEEDCRAKPKRRRCSQCEYALSSEFTTPKTVQQIFFEHQAMDRGYWHLQQVMDKLKAKDND